MKHKLRFLLRIQGTDGLEYGEYETTAPFVPYAGMQWIFSETHSRASGDGDPIESVVWLEHKEEFACVMDGGVDEGYTLAEIRGDLESYYGVGWVFVDARPEGK